MKTLRFTSIWIFCFLLIGCGADEEAAYELDSDNIPVVTIEKVQVDGETIDADKYVKVAFKVVSDIAPKNDLLVDIVYNGSICRDHDHAHEGDLAGWTTIPKGEKSSKVYSRDVYVHGYSYVSIRPLPTVSIVGEGEVIDEEALEKYWGDYTLDEQKIPEGFRFPIYEVGDIPTSDLFEWEDFQATYLYRPGPAKIISVDPPNGSLIVDKISEDTYPHLKSEITITFDTPPECPLIDGNTWRWIVDAPGGPVTFRQPNPSNGRRTPFLRFTIMWGDSDYGTAGSQTFEYPVGTKPY